jgi:hypothetical protein
VVIAERFRFHKRHQSTGESVKDYVAELRKLSEYCEFRDSLEDTLRDRFVCGIRGENVQRKLLPIQDLTLQKTIDIATEMTTASKDAAELRSTVPVENVGKIAKSKRPKQLKPKRKKQHKKADDQKEKLSFVHCGKENQKSEKCRL